MKKILITIAMVFTLLGVGCDNSPSGPVDWADGKTYTGPVTQTSSDGTKASSFQMYVTFDGDDILMGDSLENQQSIRDTYSAARWTISKTKTTWKLSAPEFEQTEKDGELEVTIKASIDVTATKLDNRSITFVLSTNMKMSATTPSGEIDEFGGPAVMTGTLVLVEE